MWFGGWTSSESHENVQRWNDVGIKMMQWISNIFEETSKTKRGASNNMPSPMGNTK